MKNKKGQIALLAWLGVLTFAGLFIYFVGRPMTSASVETYKDKLNNDATYQKNQEKLSTLKDTSSKMDELNTVIDKALNFIPKDKNISDLIVQVEGAAQNSGLAITEIKFDASKTSTGSQNQNQTQNQNQGNSASKTGEPSEQSGSTSSSPSSSSSSTSTAITIEGAAPINFTCTVSGAYPNILKFIQKINSLSRFVAINSVSITTQDKTLSAEISMIAFYKD